MIDTLNTVVDTLYVTESLNESSSFDWLALLSLVVSFIAVFFTYRGLKRMREHNQKSFQPLLRPYPKFSKKNKNCEVMIRNKGLGPAIITDVELKIGGESIAEKQISEIDDKLSKKAEKICKRESEGNDIFDLSYYSLSKNDAIRAGEDYNYFVFKLDDDISRLVEVLEGFEISIMYKSMYGIEDKIEFDIVSMKPDK